MATPTKKPVKKSSSKKAPKTLFRRTTPKDVWKGNKLAITAAILIAVLGFGIYKSYQVFFAKAGTILDNKTKVMYSYRPDGTGYDADYACYSANTKTLQAAILPDNDPNYGEVPLQRGQVYGGPGMAYYAYAFYGPKSDLDQLNGSYGQLNFGPARVVGSDGRPVYVASNYSWLGGPTGTTFTPGTVPLVDPATGKDNYLAFLYEIRGTWQRVNVTSPISLRSIPTCEGGPSLDGTRQSNPGTADAKAAYDYAVSHPQSTTNPNASSNAANSGSKATKSSSNSGSKTNKTTGATQTGSQQPKTNGTKN